MEREYWRRWYLFLTLRYANSGTKILREDGISMADGRLLKMKKWFYPVQAGKWNYITTNTGSMINAGTYSIKIIAEDASE